MLATGPQYAHASVPVAELLDLVACRVCKPMCMAQIVDILVYRTPACKLVQSHQSSTMLCDQGCCLLLTLRFLKQSFSQPADRQHGNAVGIFFGRQIQSINQSITFIVLGANRGPTDCPT